jgi:NAD(P)-dependent dehydrogenase (short-subunit alcohol dehydrogenase family)
MRRRDLWHHPSTIYDMETTQKNSRIWFITGISSGLGLALAEAVIAAGEYVIGTLRDADQVADFNLRHLGRAEAVRLDLRNPDDIAAAFAHVERQHGRLNVLVNNAGFGFAGAIEEASMEEVRAVMEANFFGALQVTQAALPMMRRQKAGHILQISSHGGFRALPGFGVYNASKFALEGMSEALAAELAPLGIRLTIVEPGPFRTGFAGERLRMAAQEIPDYAASAGMFRQRLKAVDGQQEGDPAKAAQALLALTHSAHAPLRMPLGKVALASLAAKLDSVRQDLEQGRAVAEGVVFGD